MGRNFEQWLSTFRDSIADFAYYSDFPKIYRNVEEIKIPLNILNSLIGVDDIENKFDVLIRKYPETIRCIPLLLAVRANEVKVTDADGIKVYNFSNGELSIDDCKLFMRKTGLFDLIGHHIINNLVDYATGVETGLDSNSRKNRGGHLMENLVEGYIRKAGFKKDMNYFKEMKLSDVVNKWNLDLSAISNNGSTEKRFDFVVKTENDVYAVETNFYTSGGSKLNETARSYKTIALESRDIKDFSFVWFTDGIGWLNAKGNLKETFDVLKNLYNIADLEHGIIFDVFK